MQERWSQLTHELLGRGWTSRDGQLHAPHEMMSLTAVSDDPNLHSLRQRMSDTADEIEPRCDTDPEYALLHEDLTSLVEALDVILDDGPAWASWGEPAYAMAN